MFKKVFTSILIITTLSLMLSAPAFGAEAKAGAETETAASKEEYIATALNIKMVGDILLHDPIEEAAKQEDESLNFDFMFSEVKEDIESADLAIVNQEIILGGTELGISGWPVFNAPFEVADALVDAGFDVVLQGTNHAYDKGKKGILNCLENWKEKYPEIAVLGIHETQEDKNRVYVYEKDGFKIAILNYTYNTSKAMPQKNAFMVDRLEKSKVLKDIKWAEKHADFTIVCPHWGTEYTFKVNDTQRAWAKLFLANGVDLVIGTHPHVIQPIEMMKDKAGHKMLVYYSIGNFINSTENKGKGIAKRMLGGIADVTLAKDENGKVSIESYGVIPVVTHVEYKTNGIVTYKLSEYTEELAKANEINKTVTDFSYEYLIKTTNKVWGNILGDEFKLPEKAEEKTETFGK